MGMKGRLTQPQAIERWRTLRMGRWCLMLFVSVRTWLVVRDNTILLSANSLAALIAAGLALAFTRARQSALIFYPKKG
jgi:hypothetical protein